MIGGLHRPRRFTAVEEVIGDHVLRLAETEFFEPRGIIGPGVAHHHGRGAVEAIDEKPCLVIDREAERALNAGSTLGLQPIGGGRHEGREDCRIILRLDEAELAHAILVDVAAQAANLGGDAAHGLARPLGQEELHLCMLEIGVLFRIEVLEAFEVKRRHPVGVVPVKGEGHIEEGLDVCLAAHRPDADGLGHGQNGLTRAMEELKLGEGPREG